MSGPSVEELRAKLENDKLKLEIQKLRGETNRVGRFASRVWPIVATAITLLVSVIAIVVSIGTQTRQLNFDAQKKHDETLMEAVKLATDGSAGADRRVAGIWQLNQFWANSADAPFISSVLAAELAVHVNDDDRFVRCAAAEVLGHAMQDIPARDRPRIAQLLFGSKDGQIGLVMQQHRLIQSLGLDNGVASGGCNSPGTMFY